MELMWLKIECLQFLVRDFNSFLIDTLIQSCRNPQALFRGCMANEFNDRLVGRQRLASPMNADIRKQPMFNFVPFARSRWIVTDGHVQPVLIHQGLETPFPQARMTPIAATAIGR